MLSTNIAARMRDCLVRQIVWVVQLRDLEKVFSPFVTTREKGTGLGLAVAAKIIEAHGGTIEARSEPGKGAALTLRLPRMVV